MHCHRSFDRKLFVVGQKTLRPFIWRIAVSCSAHIFYQQLVPFVIVDTSYDVTTRCGQAATCRLTRWGVNYSTRAIPEHDWVTLLNVLFGSCSTACARINLCNFSYTWQGTWVSRQIRLEKHAPTKKKKFKIWPKILFPYRFASPVFRFVLELSGIEFYCLSYLAPTPPFFIAFDELTPLLRFLKLYF